MWYSQTITNMTISVGKLTWTALEGYYREQRALEVGKCGNCRASLLLLLFLLFVFL